MFTQRLWMSEKASISSTVRTRESRAFLALVRISQPYTSWRTSALFSMASFCDFSIFIHAPAQILRERLISRKIAGGLTRQVAEAFYARTDGPNVERVLMNSRQANLIVEMTEEGRYHFTS